VSELKDVIDLILTEDDSMKAMKGNNKGHPIIIDLEENNTSLDSETEIISSNLIP